MPLKTMGAYYFYVNDSKRQYFSIDPVLNSEIKLGCLGESIGSRALSFLLWHDPLDSQSLPDNELIGSWIGDRILVASDGNGPDFQDQYTEIRQPIVEMLLMIEPFAVMKYAGESWVEELANNLNEDVELTARMRTAMLDAFSAENASYPSDFFTQDLEGFRKRGITGR